ncbi:FitA-like ribbon-helix-helix domain-containing protein [Methylopila capsulata]|uniref:Plasmid stabilization protein n=1 Tax=Methylopila capsulata TaxID=61654 RepID=A0A9W6MRC3_9HYPH|nr:plasmid stabilization protein [Methylopila capsulata]GLK54851.1 plasmid stabilization protein [Methylopila capsulata]
MASLTIRNLDEATKAALRVRAATHGRSMEDEARRILNSSLSGDIAPRQGNLADAIAAIFDPLGGVELDIPPREPMREPPDFSGPDSDAYDHPRHERSV